MHTYIIQTENYIINRYLSKLITVAEVVSNAIHDYVHTNIEILPVPELTRGSLGYFGSADQSTLIIPSILSPCKNKL